MASFDENGKYIKTNWKAGDKITATKLNKIEESIEAVNDNDISRHVEADARLDALEAKDVAHDKEFTNVKNLIEDAKDAAELGDYEINSRMQFLEQELNEGIAEVNNVASTVDGKIAAADASMKAMVAEVEADLEGLHTKDEELSAQLSQSAKSVNTYNLLLEGCVGDGITDNKEIIENVFSNLTDGDSVYIPHGTYLIKLSDSDLKDVGMTRKPMFPWIVLNNKSNIKIWGSGTLKIECDENMVKKASIFMFVDCLNIKINDLTIQGDAVFNSDITYTDVGLNGISLIRCHNAQVEGIKMYNILSALGVTGDINTPTSSNLVANDIIITNCIFKNYGQISTFGNGVSRCVFANNICANPMQCGFKVSTNVEGVDVIDKANNIILSNNIMYWDEFYRFPQVGWDIGKTFCPVGFMIESHTNNIRFTNNIVDMSKITDNLPNPITDYAPIVLHGEYIEGHLTNEGIEINNNKLHSVNQKPSIILNPNLASIIISDNELKGGIYARTFTQNTIVKTKGVYIKNNTFLDDFYVSVKNIKTNVLLITGNNALNSNAKTLESIIFEENDIDQLIIENNKLPHEIIKTYNTLTCSKITINNNMINRILNLSYDNTNGILEVCNNNFTYNGTLSVFDIINDTTMVVYNGNTGNTNGSIISINKGKLHLNGNSVVTKTSTPFNLGNAIVQSGLFSSKGAPSVDAGVGVMYRNLNAVSPALYIKIGDGEGQDKWRQL